MDRDESSRRKTALKLLPGEALIVRGHCSLEIRDGAVECFGGMWMAPLKISLRPLKQYYFYARDETCEILIQGSRAYRKINDDPVPKSWRALVTKIVSQMPSVALVIGPPDAGKSTLSTFLTNQLLTIAPSVCVVDSDIGQNDMGPPGTISIGVARRPVIDLGKIKPLSTRFIGFLSPSIDPEKLNSNIISLLQHSRVSYDFVIVNSDGWTSGPGLAHKASLISKVNPDVVISLLDEYLNKELSSMAPGAKIVRVDRSPLSMRRTISTRRAYRDALFLRHLAGGRTVSYSLDDLSLLGPNIPKSGSLVGLLKDDELLGLGIFEEFDSKTSKIRVFTKVGELPSAIEVGHIDLEHLLPKLKS